MMYLLLSIISFFSASTTLSQWSSNGAKDLKQPVNFSGTITTHQGQEFIVDNISIQGKYKQIPMIDKPLNHAEKTMNADTKQYEIKLEANPNTEFTKTNIDLEELSTISVPYPNIIWIYQKKERHQKIEFVEVEVTTKSNTKTSYLLDPKTPVYCDAIDSAGPQEKTVPLSAVNTLTIAAWTFRDTSKDKDKKCSPCDAKKD